MPLSESQIAARLSDNLALVRQRIALAAARAGRSADEVRLVGVTKYVEPRLARLLFEAGQTDLGESRPQELWHKAKTLAEVPVAWHLIGHLQRNKVRRTLPLVTCIQSADSWRLLQEISRETLAQGLRAARVLLEVNVSGDIAKHGLKPDEVEPLLPAIAELPGLSVQGLMTMAALEGNPDRARRDFAALRELRERLVAHCPANVSLHELSMGMSGDYEIAIAEGATIVRVGSALFENLPLDSLQPSASPL